MGQNGAKCLFVLKRMFATSKHCGTVKRLLCFHWKSIFPIPINFFNFQDIFQSRQSTVEVSLCVSLSLNHGWCTCEFSSFRQRLGKCMDKFTVKLIFYQNAFLFTKSRKKPFSQARDISRNLLVVSRHNYDVPPNASNEVNCWWVLEKVDDRVAWLLIYLSVCNHTVTM